MANFTTEEIQAAVENLVQSTIRRPYDTLGVRRTDVSFTDIQQAAAGVFLLYPKAPYYCLSLGARAIEQLIAAEAQTISDLINAIGAVGRRVLPVEDVSPLFNAKVALESLGQAAIERANAFRDITTVPAYQRFEKNVNEFLAKNGDAVKEAGEIVDTPQGAKKKLATLVERLEAQHLVLVERVQYLANGEDDYTSVNLAAIVAQSVLSKSASVMEEHAEALNALQPEQRLENLRKVVLDLIAMRSVVKKYGSFAGPTKLYAVTGTGTPYSDASHLANPATVVCDRMGPYSITPTNNVLELYLDGSSTPTTLNLPYSYWPRIDGAVNEITQDEGTGWIIGNGSSPLRDDVNEGPAGDGNIPNNNAIRITFTGVPRHCPLTLSADGDGLNVDATPRTVEQICTDINTVISPHGWQAVPYMAPRKFYGIADITPIAGAQGTISLVGGFGNFGAVGIVAGMLVNVLDGTEAGLWTIDTVAATSLTATRVDAATVVGASSSTFEVGPKERRLRIEPIDKLLALNSLYNVVCDPNDTPTKNAAETLGLVPGVTYKARPSTAKDVAEYINSATTLATAGTSFSVQYPNTKVRTNPSDSMKLTLSKYKAVASVVTWDGVTYTATIDGAASAGVVVGDRIVVRTGSEVWLSVTSVTDTQIEAVSFLFGTPVAGTDVILEFAEPFALSGLITENIMVRINSGANAGDYYVEKCAGIDMTLTTPLPAPIGGLDGEVKLTADLGNEFLTLSSANRTTQSRVRVGGTAISEFFSVGHVATTTGVYGTTRFFKLPQKTAVGVGDLLLLYGTTYVEPDTVHELLAVEGGEILTLDVPVASNVNWVFSPSATVPYARLQTGETFNYDAFQAQLTSWASRAQQQPRFFTDLNRFINPLISNASPTAAQVGDATNKVNDLHKFLTAEASTLYGGNNPLEEIVGTYSTSYQQAVDALLRSFKEKGADRAYDFLIQGRFSEFFVMDMDSASYAGTMQKAMRDVVMNDLSIRKTDRGDRKVSRLLSTVTSPDPEYNLDDTEQAVPDPAGQGEF